MAGAAISYTQWEAWLALYFDKDLVIAAPGSNFARDLTLTPNFAPTEQCKAAQAAHLERLRALGCYPEVNFADNGTTLSRKSWPQAVVDALGEGRRLARASAAQPAVRWLGRLFVGRDKALDDLRAALTAAKGVAVAGQGALRARRDRRARLAMDMPAA